MVTERTQHVDRRPVAARGWRGIRQIARWLARVHVSPNAVSLAGMLCGVTAGVSLGWTSVASPSAWAAWWVAAGLILLRATANVVDGLVAVEFGHPNRVGVLYNEVPDRISDAATLIGLGYAAGGNAVLGYAAACAALLVAYVRAVGATAGAPQEFGGLMGKQQRMFIVVAIALYAGLISLAPGLPHTPGLDPMAATFQLGGATLSFPLATVGLAVIFAGCLWTAVWRLRRIAAVLRKSTP